MLHVYTSGHRLPHVSASHELSVSTLVSPSPVTDVPSTLTQLFPESIPRYERQLGHYQLDYPDPSPGAAGVQEVVRRYANCARCHLSESRTRICFVKGNPEASVVAIGEGPGRREDSHGECFVGPSGKLQDELFIEQGIHPTRDLAWMNLVGCRPCDTRFEADRPPSQAEKLACSERTLMLLRALRPRVVLCLGEQSTQLFWDEPPPPNTYWTFKPEATPDDWFVVGVARHPSYLLRSVVTRYQEYFSAKLFLSRLKRKLPGLTKLSAWTHTPHYLKGVEIVAGGLQ